LLINNKQLEIRNVFKDGAATSNIYEISLQDVDIDLVDQFPVVQKRLGRMRSDTSQTGTPKIIEPIEGTISDIAEVLSQNGGNIYLKVTFRIKTEYTNNLSPSGTTEFGDPIDIKAFDMKISSELCRMLSEKFNQNKEEFLLEDVVYSDKSKRNTSFDGKSFGNIKFKSINSESFGPPIQERWSRLAGLV
jgi:hypothetical protein